MGTLVVDTNISGPGTPVQLGEVNSLWVTRTGVVVSTDDSFGVFGSGSGHTVHIEGAVAGNFGIVLGNDPTLDSGNSVLITSTGVVRGSAFGVLLSGADAQLNNFGLISGTILMNGAGPGLSRIDNAGDIISGNIAVRHTGDETLSFNNTGVIRSISVAFESTGTTAIDLIRNRGEMIGDILLGDNIL